MGSEEKAKNIASKIRVKMEEIKKPEKRHEKKEEERIQ